MPRVAIGGCRDAAAFGLEQAATQGAVRFYARNDQLGFHIPYDFHGSHLAYEPDFLVRLSNDVTLILEIKGHEDAQDRAKHAAARRWVQAVNNWGELGRWDFHVSHDPHRLAADLKHKHKAQA